MATVLEQLEAMRQVKENWDGYHAAAPHPAAIDLARDIVRLLEAARGSDWVRRLQAGPNPPGGVTIDWEDEAAEHEIDLAPDGSIEFLSLEKATGQIRTHKILPERQAVVHPEFLRELRHLLAA